MLPFVVEAVERDPGLCTTAMSGQPSHGGLGAVDDNTAVGIGANLDCGLLTRTPGHGERGVGLGAVAMHGLIVADADSDTEA